MKIINYISNLAMPLIILSVVLYGLKEKSKVFDTFLVGAQEGIKTTFRIFPTLVGLFVAIGALRSSGLLDFITHFAEPVLKLINFPGELMPLALLRPISGSGSVAIANNIMQTYGVDSLVGKMASTIMGSTETTLYTIAIYTSCVNIKKTRGILFASLTADVVGIAVSIIVCRLLLG